MSSTRPRVAGDSTRFRAGSPGHVIPGLRYDAAPLPTGLIDRIAPFTRGERFSVPNPGGDRPERFRVVEVRASGYVVAVREAGEASAPPTLLDTLRATLGVVGHLARPYFHALYPARHPSLGGTGQFLILLSDLAVAGYAGAGHFWLDRSSHPYSTGLFLVAHEIAHTYAREWRVSRTCPGCALSFAAWGDEGIANFVAREVVRLRDGVAFDANVVARSDDAYGRPDGNILRGFESSEGFFRHLTWRLMTEGRLAYGTAAAAVARGAVEGMDAWDEDGQRVKGLTARVRAHLPEFDLERPILLWTLSWAADDHLLMPVLNDPTFLRVGRELETARRPLRSARLDAGDGAAVALTGLAAGYHGYVQLHDRGQGISTQVVSTVPSLRFLLVRIR